MVLSYKPAYFEINPTDVVYGVEGWILLHEQTCKIRTRRGERIDGVPQHNRTMGVTIKPPRQHMTTRRRHQQNLRSETRMITQHQTPPRTNGRRITYILVSIMYMKPPFVWTSTPILLGNLPPPPNDTPIIIPRSFQLAIMNMNTSPFIDSKYSPW